MQKAGIHLILLLIILSGCSQTRQVRTLGNGWRFSLINARGAEKVTFDDSQWRVMDVPHDWSVERVFSKDNSTGKAGGFLPAGVGWYRKDFSLAENVAQKRVFVDFDGVMANSDVWVNGKHLGHRPNGYVSFEYELTPFVHAGVNLLAVRCDNSLQPASRWYSGAGIYRHVHLVITNPVHVEHWGTFVSTPKVSADNAVIKIENRVVNEDVGAVNIAVRTTIVDPAGKAVASQITPGQQIAAKNSVAFDQEISLAHPLLWNPEQPNLYTARVEVLRNNQVLDTQTTPFGIREFHFDSATGFWLNGKNFKLFGCCLHQDAGALGIAVPIGVWRQRLEELRSIGCNAIRTSHNPPDPAFLDLCDRMGFLVMDEMFDVWAVGKTPLLSRQTLNDYHLYYQNWWRADVTNTVLRDRNHPCVILYSAGNEIHDIRANSDLGFQIFRPLRDLYHQLDPTRPVTLALLRPNQTGVYKNGFADLLDVVGQNYRENELVAAHAEHPQWKIIGTENHLDPEAWDYLRDTPAYSGQFIWTGFDYLGESIGWPIVGSGSGLFDRTGWAKPQAYQAQSWWTHKPMVYIARVVAMPRLDFPPAEPGMDAGPRMRSRLVSDWTERGVRKMERVQVYTNCQNVELLLNNKSLGTQDRSAEDEPLEWNVPFAAGTLKAVARNEGKVAATYELRTAGPAVAVKLVADRKALRAGDDDALYVRAQVVDKDGTIVPDANNLITFSLNGPGKIVAVDSADNTCHDPFHSVQRHAYQGQCVAILQGTAAGKIVVNANGAGLSPGSVTTEIKTTEEMPSP